MSMEMERIVRALLRCEPRPGPAARFAWVLAALMAALASSHAAAQEDMAEAPQESTEPIRVHIGILWNRIEAMSLKDNTYVVDFYIWLRWMPREIDGEPFDAGATFEVVNGSIDSRNESEIRELDDGGMYASYRVRATIVHYFDVTRYPIDSYTLPIEIEDALDTNDVVYIADVANSALGDQFRVPGFRHEAPRFEVVPHIYQTNYGDPETPTGAESEYSRFIASVFVERPSKAFALKMFAGLYVATLIGFLAMFVSPLDLDPRFGLGVAAIFAAVATQIVISSNLPETNTLTLADQVSLLATIFIFLSLVESTYALSLCKRQREDAAKRLDRRSFVCLLALYAAVNVWVLM